MKSEMVGPRAQGWQRVNKEGGGYHAIIILGRKSQGYQLIQNLQIFHILKGKISRELYQKNSSTKIALIVGNTGRGTEEEQ